MATEIEFGMRELRNHTKDVLKAIEAGRPVHLTNHGKRIATITPYVPDDIAQLVAMVDRMPRGDSGAHDELVASRTADAEAEDAREDTAWH